MAEGAGWYADPSGRADVFRWWDGSAWTRWLSADPEAPDPGPAPSRPVPGAAPSASTPASTSPAPSGARPLGTGANPAGSTAYAPPRDDALDLLGPPAPDPADRVRLPVAAAAVVGAVVLALVAVGAVVTFTADRPLTGPAVAPPPPVPAPLAVTFDATTRTATVEELRVVLPAEPFTCDPRPTRARGLFASTLVCRAVVHQGYDQGKDWLAVAGVGLLEKGPADDTDLRQLLATTAAAIVRRDYPPDRTTVTKGRNRPYAAAAPDGRARRVTAELRLADPKLPTAYDELRAVLVRLESGRHVLWWALRPEDSPAAIGEALRVSEGTLTARK